MDKIYGTYSLNQSRVIGNGCYIVYVVIVCAILYFGTTTLYVNRHNKKYYNEARDTVVSYTHH